MSEVAADQPSVQDVKGLIVRQLRTIEYHQVQITNAAAAINELLWEIPNERPDRD